ncbi:hypothetical protein [Halobacillus sp. B29]|uniref:hypothetical protein n=1 Tax=Halobacillus sp. B29 TaxID=3457432 RepID=UPI003FCD697B
MFVKMKKIFSVLMIEFIRILLGVIFSYPENKRGKRDVNKDIEELLKIAQQNLVKSQRLNKDFTIGPVPGPTKSTRKLIDAFVRNRSLLEESEQKFYLQVAEEWAIKLFNSYYVTLVCTGVFLITYFSTYLIYPYLTGQSSVIWLMTLILSSFIGIISAKRIKGRRKWVFLPLNIFLFTAFLIRVIT